MARGWESKSVEQQQDEAQRTPDGLARAPMTAEERERQQRREQLRLALALTQDELQKASHPTHRDMLRQRMDALKAEIEQ